jgi:hypothetical protein
MSLTSALLIIFYIINLSLLGYLLLDLCNKKISPYDLKTNNLIKICSYFILGLGFLVIFSHLISFFTNSYKLSLNISGLVVFLVNATYCLTRTKVFFSSLSKNIFKFTKIEILFFCLILFFSLQVYKVEVLTHSSYDKKHHCITSCLLENDIYPPREPADKNTSMAGYHYGLNLIAASISHLNQMPVWEAHGVEMAIFTFIIFVFSAALVNIFITNYSISIFLGMYVIFFLSFQNFEFLLRFYNLYSKMDLLNIFNLYNNISYLVAKNLQTRLYFYSPNLGFALSFVQFFSIIKALDSLKEQKRIQIQPLLIVFAASFLNYFSEVMWHSVLIGFSLYLLLNLCGDLITKKLKVFCKDSWIRNLYHVDIAILLSLILGKVFCFNKSIVNSGTMKELIFAPSLSYKQGTGWGAFYQELFIGVDKLRSYKITPSPSDYYSSFDFNVPIFSEMAWREILIFVLLATLAFLLNFSREKKITSLDIIFLSGFGTALIPFFIEYLPRPSEEIRFIIFAKPFLIFYTIVSLFYYLTSKNKFRIVSTCIILLLGLNIIPSFLNLSLARGPHNNNLTVTEDQKHFVKSFKKIHKSGDVCIDDKIYIAWMGESTLAGCYNTGYRTFRENYTTRTTAINLMNPLLLKELDVDYVIISNYNGLSPLGQERLNNKNLFTQVIDEKIKVYRLNKNFSLDKPSYDSLATEYIWALVWETSPTQVRILQSNDNRPIVSFNRSLLEQQKIITQEQFKNKNPEFATWISVQALPIRN